MDTTAGASMEGSTAHPLESSIPNSSSSHSSVDPRTILDLPVEILEKIMSHLVGGADENDENGLFMPTGRADIKNVRLSCRGLSPPATRFLTNRVKVNVSLSSLTRFENICEHTIMHKGVLGVEFCLAQYDDDFDDGVEGFKRFIQHHLLDLESRLRRARVTIQPQAAVEIHQARAAAQCWKTFLGILEIEGQELVGTFDEELDSIRQLGTAWDTGYNAPLLEGYIRYRHRLHEQTSLQNGDFVARVSASMAKLPRVKHLKITDWDTARWGQQADGNNSDSRLDLWGQEADGNNYARIRLDLSDHESVVESLAKFRSAFKDVQGNTLVPLIPSLVCTTTGMSSLNIRISPSVVSCAHLSLSIEKDAQLKSSLTKLRSFIFENYSSRIMNPSNEVMGFGPLGRFIDACLTSNDLEHLVLNPKIRNLRIRSSIFTARVWPKLRSVELVCLPVSVRDLHLLTKSLSSQLERSLALYSVHLYCGGMWASILDMLRDRRIRVKLGYQCGGEFETEPSVGQQVFEGVRRNDGRSFPNFAEYYVHGEDMPNPILCRPDEELWNRLFVPELNREDEDDSDDSYYDHEVLYVV